MKQPETVRAHLPSDNMSTCCWMHALGHIYPTTCVRLILHVLHSPPTIPAAQKHLCTYQTFTSSHVKYLAVAPHPPFPRRNHTPLLSITNTTSPTLSYPYPPVPPITHTRIHIMCTNIAHFVCGPLRAILRYLHDLCSSSSSSSSAQHSHTGSAESGGVLWTEPYKEPIAVPARVAVSSSPRRVPVVVVSEERARHLSW